MIDIHILFQIKFDLSYSKRTSKTNQNTYQSFNGIALGKFYTIPCYIIYTRSFYNQLLVSCFKDSSNRRLFRCEINMLMQMNVEQSRVCISKLLNQFQISLSS